MKALLTTIIAGAVIALAMPALGQYTPVSREDTTVAGQGTVGGSSTLASYRGQVNTSVITFGSVGATLTDTTANGDSQLVFTFPEGRILIIGGSVDATVTNNVFTEATANDVYYTSIGTTAAVTNDADLTTTEANFIAKTTHDTASNGTLSFSWEADFTSGADSVFDGTATASALYVNVAAADTTISATSGVVGISGSATVVWAWLGDD